jgi:uncharacterized protein YwgA/DNA-binding HxlR family transcriptional regulator
MMQAIRKSKAPEILLALSKGPKHVRELLAEVKGSALTLEDRIQELLEEGLIKEEKMEKWPYRKVLKLTESGEEVAKLLKLEESFIGATGKTSRAKMPERAKWILALLHAVGGIVRGSIRLQKLFFLMKRELGIEELPYDFSPYQFGPFSRDILEDAADLENAGLIEVKKEIFEPTSAGDYLVSRTFSLTSKGSKLAEESYNNMPENVKKVLSELEKFNKMELTELLNYVYTKYPKESKILD